MSEYRVIDDLHRLRVHTEQLVGRAVLRVELKQDTEQGGGGASHGGYEGGNLPLLLQASHVPVLQPRLHPEGDEEEGEK